MHRYFLAILAITTVCPATVCLANDTPQPVRRVHYLEPIYNIHSPLPVRIASAPTEIRTDSSAGPPQAIRIDADADFPHAWTLDQAIAATLTSDPVLRIGQGEISQAKAELLGASLLPNPSLEIAGASIPFHRRGADMEPEFSVQMEMPLDWFLFAKRAAERHSAGWDVQKSQAEYADLVRQRITETATAFYDVLEAKALLAVARQDLEILTSVESVTQRAVAAGGVPSVELDRISLEIFRRRQEILHTEAELNVAKARLWARFGRADREGNFDVRGSLDAPMTVQPYPTEEAFELAKRNRPDIRALRIQVNKAQADRELERRNAYPEVSLSGGYIREYLEEGREPGWGIGVSMTVPIFDRNQGGRAKSQAVLRQSHYELQSGMIELRAEVEAAEQYFRSAYLRASTYAQKEVQTAIRVRNSTIQSYEAGGSPLIDVLDAERTYRETYRMYISSRADYWRAMYVYNSVIGQ